MSASKDVPHVPAEAVVEAVQRWRAVHDDADTGNTGLAAFAARLPINLAYASIANETSRETGRGVDPKVVQRLLARDLLTFDEADRLLVAAEAEHLWRTDERLRPFAVESTRRFRCQGCRRAKPVQVVELFLPGRTAQRGNGGFKNGSRKRRAGTWRYRSFLFCDDCAAEKLAPRGGVAPKRGGRPRLFTDAQLRAAHVIYEREQLSMNDLSVLLSTQGQGTQGGVVSALHYGWKRLGLKQRAKAETQRLAHHRRGRVPKINPVCAGTKRSGEPCTAKAKHGEQFCVSHLRFGPGPKKRPCAGVKQYAPRRGAPCRNYVTGENDYCRLHDPALADERNARLAALRSRIGRYEERLAA